MKLIRSLVFPWFVFFVAAVTTLVILGIKAPHIELKTHPLYNISFGAGAFLCILANLRSLGGVGIWMLESLPDSLRYTSWRWILRALKAAAIAAIFWFVGRLPWMPLVWQGVVVPSVFTICLFVIIFSLFGPILKFSANMAWSRAFSVILSLPFLAAVPATAAFIGQNVVTAYRASQPHLVAAAEPAPQAPTEETKPTKTQTAEAEPKPENLKEQDIRNWIKNGKADQKARALRSVTLKDKRPLCAEHTKEIQALLDPAGQRDVVLAAVRAVECTEIRSVIGLPRLAQLMMEHKDPQVRAASISAMKKFGNENVRQIAYLLVKRINDNEAKEVVEAAAVALAPLGPDEQRYTTNRLKGLLGAGDVSMAAAKVLVQTFGRDDLVADYVATNLTGADEARRHSMEMICLLPKAKRAIAEPHIAQVVATVKTADVTDPGLRALTCLGKPGFKAIRDEITNPKVLQKPVAARALAVMDMEDAPEAEALEIAGTCSMDGDAQVRQWCSQTLGQIGAPALPKILDLLKSNDSSLKEAGRNALRYFDDPSAKDELQKIRADNSGWMANNKKLEIAKAVGSALIKIEHKQSPQG